MGVPALATRQRQSAGSETEWQELGRSADGTSQIRANATPGCDANPRTILCKTESTCCSEVTVTAKESSDSAASKVPTKRLSPFLRAKRSTSFGRSNAALFFSAPNKTANR